MPRATSQHQQMATASPRTVPPSANSTSRQTFLGHVHELRSRLFWVVATLIITSAAAYPFKNHIIDFMVAPLGGQELYYLTPVGGFTFIIKICTYVGIIMTIPMIVYQLYRYLEPIMGVQKRSVVFYVLFSSFMASLGVAFAYIISLPAALHFLTGLELEHVTSMLTVDAYLSFVITYLLGAALLFQMPLLLLIINSVKPLPPRTLLGFTRYIVLGAFVIAAVISPTPDITNQVLLAAPIIIMYFFGIVLVAIRNHHTGRKQKRKLQRDTVRPEQTQRQTAPQPLRSVPASSALAVEPAKVQAVVANAKYKPVQRSSRSVDGFHAVRYTPKRPLPSLSVAAARTSVVEPAQVSVSVRPAVMRGGMVRSLDGFMVLR